MAKTPHHENAVRRYPDDPHPGTTRTNGGAIPNRASKMEQPIPMVIARIDTVPMTTDELDNAAEALAVLLNHFLDDHPHLTP
ncbi:hypothetical protein D0Q02_30380 [Micromonospora craniellae]|uniref:Uncharacterized protein n=1 Tax=Micromonospora craniellae TaxID=2294034 RepID=A0A372FQZ4_9ACTN|nr:hypothetical protein ID554_22425 [Micromonospora craniellae]RFS40510.1 hypothetical protein D0Q02_30380 [Micromonospora craniellae]